MKKVNKKEVKNTLIDAAMIALILVGGLINGRYNVQEGATEATYLAAFVFAGIFTFVAYIIIHVGGEFICSRRDGKNKFIIEESEGIEQ